MQVQIELVQLLPELYDGLLDFLVLRCEFLTLDVAGIDLRGWHIRLHAYSVLC